MQLKKSNVVIPGQLLREATSKEEVINNVKAYIAKNYPGYKITGISKGYAICVWG